MGAAAARRLAADGYQVAILSSSGKGEALGKELGGIGVTGSNQSNDDLKRLVDETMARLGRVDVLVNSAGHGPRAPLLDITDEQWHAGIDVYFMSVVRPVRLVAPIMKAQRGGAIINIFDSVGFRTQCDVPDLGSGAGWACCLHQDFRRHICGRQYTDEQRTAGLDRQSAGNGGTPRECTHEAVRH